MPAKPERTDGDRTQLKSGSAGLPAFEGIAVFTVRLFRDLLSKSEDCLGRDGVCLDFLARFAEAGLAP